MQLPDHYIRLYIYVVDGPLNKCMTDDIITLKAICRKNELICKAVKRAISKRKSELMEQRVLIVKVTRNYFYPIHYLLGRKKNTVLPEYSSSFTFASTINMFL